MVTASLIKKEGDISFMLPANVEQYEMITLPIEVLIEINQDNVVESSGMRFQDTDREMNNLVYQINGLSPNRRIPRRSIFCKYRSS